MKDYKVGFLNPGQSEEVSAPGDYIRNIGQGEIEVTAKHESRPVKAFKTLIGAGGSRSPEDEYTNWYITNKSSVAIDVKVLIGKGDATETEVQISADVNAISEAKNKTADGNQFVVAYNVPANTTNSSQIAIHNPASSGVDVNVTSAMAEITALGHLSYQPDAYFAGWGDMTTAFEAGLQNINKNGQQANSKGRLMTSVVSVFSAAYFATFKSGSFNDRQFFSESAPFVIKPGYGLVFVPYAANQSIYLEAEWSETANA